MKSNLGKIIAISIAIITLSTNCLDQANSHNGTIQTATSSPAFPISEDKPAFGSWGIETQHISKTIKPGDDFFTYVNEGWVKSTKIPEGYWDYGQTSILAAETDQHVRDIVQGAAKTSAP